MLAERGVDPTLSAKTQVPEHSPSCQLLKQRPGVLKIGGVEALGEPVVDRREEVVGLLPLAPVAAGP